MPKYLKSYKSLNDYNNDYENLLLPNVSAIKEGTKYDIKYISKSSKYALVDMGLSVDWAACNVGANSPEEYGWYFQWGGITAYDTNRIPSNGEDAVNIDANSNCPYWESGTNNTDLKWTKYNEDDSKKVLDIEDDAAYAHMGDGWRLPTEDELYELINACTDELVENYNGTGISGRLLTLKTDPSKTLFFPLAGYVHKSSHSYANSRCYYWSRTLTDYNRAVQLGMNFNDQSKVNSEFRYYGQSIRAVRPKHKD